MSAKQTGIVWELDLPHNEAWVLMAMADHADHEGKHVYPGVPLLAWKTGYTTRRVRRILGILQEKGLIIVTEKGGGRKTTRYRLELSRGERKASHRPERAPSGRAGSIQDAESKEGKMSPLRSDAAEAPMSPQPGQNVRAARTRLCHPNRHGREASEPSTPPPSDSSPHPRPPRTVEPAPNGENGENGEGWKTSGENRRVNNDANRTAEGSAAAMWRAWIEWRGRDELPSERRQSFDRQAKALASGDDLDVWTHPVNGAIVRSSDRLRIFELGLEHLQAMTSRTLRGGVMYAVTKCYRTPPPIPGTEYAAIVARGLAGEDPGRSRAATGSTAMVAAASILQPPTEFDRWADEDPVERSERECPEESHKLRDSIAREIAAEVHGREVSEQTLLLVGRAQYRHLVLRRIDGGRGTLSGAERYA